jgi:hypothetical protein
MKRPTPNLMMGNYAAVPGSGPADKVCRNCAHLVRDACRYRCGQYKTIAKREGRPISPQTPACRYFDQRPPSDLSNAKV